MIEIFLELDVEHSKDIISKNLLHTFLKLIGFYKEKFIKMKN